jgi:hypothetical protein
MSNFNISYEDAQRILDAFYNSTYRVATGYVDILHGLKEEGSDLTLKQKIEIDHALRNAAQTVQPSNE